MTPAEESQALAGKMARQLTCPVGSTRHPRGAYRIDAVGTASGGRLKFKCPICGIEFTISDAMLRKADRNDG